MKTLSFAFLFAALGASLPASANAQEISLVVLGEGQITSSGAQELSRQVTLIPAMEGGNVVAPWKKAPKGYLCHSPEYYTNEHCKALVRVVVRLQINGLQKAIEYSATEERSTREGSYNFLTNEDYEALRGKDFSSRYGAILSEIYDVQNGTIFFERPRRFKKELRLVVDSANKELKSFEFVKKYIGWQPPHP